MRTPELLVQTLIWLPTLIAFARGSTYRWLIPLICGGIAAIDLYDIPSFLSAHNARHSIYLFAGEVVVWMSIFILSICAKTSAEARKSA